MVKMAVFWDCYTLLSCSIDRRFRGTCCLHHQGVLMMEFKHMRSVDGEVGSVDGMKSIYIVLPSIATEGDVVNAGSLS